MNATAHGEDKGDRGVLALFFPGGLTPPAQPLAVTVRPLPFRIDSHAFLAGRGRPPAGGSQQPRPSFDAPDICVRGWCCAAFFLLGLVGVSILHVKIVGLLGWCGLWKCALLVVLLPPLCCCGYSSQPCRLKHHIVIIGREGTKLKLNNTDYAAKLNLNTTGS